MPHATTPELTAAIEAARKAAAVIMGIYADFAAIPDAAAGITTEADRQSQETVLRFLQSQFPDDAYCAEEATPSLQGRPRSGPRQWVVDPIDGTRGFAQKSGEFSVMVGFVAGGVIQAGAVLEPALGRLTYALRGQGCWSQDGDAATPTRCRVSAVADLSQATLAQSHLKNPAEPSRQERQLRPARVRTTHSAGVKLALVARGEVDLYVNHYPKFSDWDICAGHILVEEAGGKVTGMGAQPLVFGTPDAVQAHGLVASNGVLHDVTIARLASGV